MSYAVQIRDTGLCALIDLQGGPEAIRNWLVTPFSGLPDRPNTAVTHQGLSLYWLAPERWLLRAPIDLEDRLLAIARPHLAPVDISVVVVSDTLWFFRLDGVDACQIVSIASPIDTHPSRFPENGVTYTDAFGIKALLVRTETGFEMAVESSYADMIADCLNRAIA